ncbi:MAG: peptide deformylase [Campylobacteraceae bacterium 4484_4]|uniref:peptide deformylase n=1 Tax=Hydrogenimonas sp. TaxID=2231112 RepID=UPI000A0B35A8|nr:peptide deformylase [Hydrogenimonas sp.]OQX72656.1 MAG: peptide deformylase [Campylobacteraceae bacterium 4484_4]
MKLPILVYPDKRLKQQSHPVTEFDAKLHKLLDDMNETMMASNGIGLAAIQVGEPIRALLINLPDEEGNQYPENLIEVINPVILEKKGSTTYTEGCLSVPEYYDDVERAEWVRVEFQDRHGEKKEIETDGLLAIAFQHEMDHLDGHLFIEKLSFLKRKKFEKEWKKKLKELKEKSKAS